MWFMSFVHNIFIYGQFWKCINVCLFSKTTVKNPEFQNYKKRMILEKFLKTLILT